MALSGTLDTFALPDVLRLLASTGKTGRLRISGDRGSGSVWVATGQVVATELTTVKALEPTDIEVVFGLLRFNAGSFSFEADAVAANADIPMAMEPILGAAENMLAEWKSIEQVVPSLDVWVGLSKELHGPDVMVDALRWRCVSTIGSGAQVGLLAETIGLNEVDSCRAVKELIELGLVEIVEAPVASAPTPTAAVPEEPVADEAAADLPAAAAWEPDPIQGDATGDDVEQAPIVAEAEVPAPTGDDFDPAVFSESENGAGENSPSLASLESSDEAAGITDASEDPTDNGLFGGPSDDEPASDDLNPAEMARQLANLSPKAAKAVAAAAKASTEAEREAALAAVEAEDDTVNRGLLLKFLGSVDS